MKLNNRRSSKPLYVQLKDAIKKEITDGKYTVGNQLPTEVELCEMYGVSRITTRRAITELVEEGIIQKQHGIGTFIASNKIKRELFAVNGFSEFLLQSGKNPRTSILSTAIIDASKREAEMLRIEEGEPVLKVRRLHLVDDDPIHLEDGHYPLNRFPGLDKYLGEADSIYSILNDRYNTQSVYNDKILQVINPTHEEASLLKCTIDIALFEILKVAFDKEKKVIHFSKSLLPTNKVSFTIPGDYDRRDNNK